MVVNMIKWRPWPPSQSKKFEAKILVRCLTGLQQIEGDDHGLSKLTVEIKWKGSRTNGFRSLRKRGVKRVSTREESLGENGVVQWDEEFKTICGFCGSKDKVDGVFNPWEVAFLVFNASEKRSKKRVPISAPAVLNLAEFASVEDARELQINVPLTILRHCFNCSPALCISLSLMELRTSQEISEEVQRPVMFAPLSPCFGTSLPTKKDEGSTLRSSLRKVKSLTDYVSSKRTKKADHGEASSDSNKFSTGSEDSEYPFDTDSLDDTDEDESGESKEDTDVQKSVSYGTLVDANLAGGAPDLRISCEDEDLVYYSNNSRDIGSSPAKDFGAEASDQVLRQSPRFRILAWRKRRLSFKSPKVKGEPLLKKDYAEEGGDDIDFDRRQLSSSDESVAQIEGSTGSGTFISEFGDDNFAVGSWEQKDILSRDGGMKLQTHVFFASIDQRSERAAGESACTALVAVIADWLHSNRREMPIKSEFDHLIREGSLQWRNLCENDVYRERFPDKHFDLETVLQAKIRPLSVVPERSFIGFFHPEGLEEECFGFLHGAMSFDNIWDEISQAASEQSPDSEPLVYVVSWNDHFFLLRVDWDAYYIIDTLGERLFEGCQQAYVLKFDQNSTIERIPTKPTSENEKPTKEKAENSSSQAVKFESGSPDQGPGEGNEGEEMVVCKGKESCKEYIKSFLAAIPIRELQADMKKGLMASTPLHHRLQIEFNYTVQFLPTPAEYVAPEIVADFPAPSDNDVTEPAVADVAELTATEVVVPVAADVSVLNVANAPVAMVALAVS